MADKSSSILCDARHHVDAMFASVAHHLEDERGKSERLQRELKAERARLPVDTATSKERSHTEKHHRKQRHRCQDVKELERKLQKVKEDQDLNISQEWHKARLLKENGEQLRSLQNAMDRQAEQLRQEQGRTVQQSAENDVLRQELNEVKRAVELGEVRSKRKLAEVQAQTDAERQNEMETEKKKRQRVEKSLKTARRQSESRISVSQRENDLLKGEICELEEKLRETHYDLQQAQSSLLLQSKLSTEKENEILRLLNEIKTLKDGHEREQQQLRNELTTAQSDTDLTKSTLATISEDYEGMRQKLDTMQKSTALFVADGGALSVIRLVYEHLRQVAPEPHKFCDATHGESGFMFVTDCGVLVYSDCLERSLPSVSIKLDCPWCPSECWTWERLTIPFSSTWPKQLEKFFECMDSWTSEILSRVSPLKAV